MKQRNVLKLILCVFFFQSFLLGKAMASDSLDGIAAVVNETIITQSELQNAMNTAKKQMAANQMPVPNETSLKKQVLDQLINRNLQLQLAEQSNINTTDEEVDTVINRIAQQNNIPLTDLYQKVETQGLSKAQYRKEIHDELVLQKIQQQEVGSKISITPQEINRFMHSKEWLAFSAKEYQLEDVLIVLPEAPTSDQIASAKTQAEKILAATRTGTSLHDAALAESINTADLGWRKLPEIPTVFADKVTQMTQNEIAGPIQAPNGLHLIHLVESRSVQKDNTALNPQTEVQQLVFQRKLEEGLQTWLAKLRSNAFIDITPGNTRATV